MCLPPLPTSLPDSPPPTQTGKGKAWYVSWHEIRILSIMFCPDCFHWLWCEQSIIKLSVWTQLTTCLCSIRSTLPSLSNWKGESLVCFTAWNTYLTVRLPSTDDQVNLPLFCWQFCLDLVWAIDHQIECVKTQLTTCLCSIRSTLPCSLYIWMIKLGDMASLPLLAAIGLQ